MKKGISNYNILMFLYAYMRQINLSLDRAKWSTWEELVKYFRNGLAPDKVVEFLERAVQKRSSEHEKIFYLTGYEVGYCQNLLLAFQTMLQQPQVNLIDADELRISIAKFYSSFIESNLNSSDLKRVTSIEHFNQNERLQVNGINEFSQAAGME